MHDLGEGAGPGCADPTAGAVGTLETRPSCLDVPVASLQAIVFEVLEIRCAPRVIVIVGPRKPDRQRAEFLARMSAQLAVCWNAEIERIVQTMVYERDGQIYDILRPENQAQVIRAMWDDPASELWPKIQCPALIVPAGPSPERANTDFARTRKRMVELAASGIPNSRVHWIPDTIHDIGYHKPEELAAVIAEFLKNEVGDR